MEESNHNYSYSGSWQSVVPTITTWTTAKPRKNPDVPEEIHVTGKTLVVKWSDGTANKVTCDTQDNFSPEIGFAMAYTQHKFGGKSEFKEKWWKIISRRIKYHENKKPVSPSYPAVEQAAKNMVRFSKAIKNLKELGAIE